MPTGSLVLVAGRSFPSYNCLTSPSEDHHFKRPSNLTSRIHRFYSPVYSSCTGFTSETVDLFSIRLPGVPAPAPYLSSAELKDPLATPFEDSNRETTDIRKMPYPINRPFRSTFPRSFSDALDPMPRDTSAIRPALERGSNTRRHKIRRNTWTFTLRCLCRVFVVWLGTLVFAPWFSTLRYAALTRVSYLAHPGSRVVVASIQVFLCLASASGEIRKNFVV
jgi:hypothetical protein